MRNPLTGLIVGLLSVLALLPMVLAQTTEPSKTAATKDQPFDPHDLSGVWGIGRESVVRFSNDEPPMKPAALTKYKSEKTQYSNPPVLDFSDTDPVLRCNPPGIPRIYFYAHPMTFVQTPDETVILYEVDSIYREIYMNGKHPEHPDNTWYGDSIGKWEGNTLVVDTTGFNDRTWIDPVGHPHSEALHLVERFTRVDHDNLRLDITIDDPRDYTKPWTGQRVFKLEPHWELEEYLCSASDEQEVLKKVMLPEAAPAGQK